MMKKRRPIWLFVVTVAVGGCEQLSPEMQLIHDAAEALGGVSRRSSGVATLRIEGQREQLPGGGRTGRPTRMSRPLRSSRTSSKPTSGITACGGRSRAPISPGGSTPRPPQWMRAWRSMSDRTVPDAQARGAARRAPRRVLPSSADAAPGCAGRDRGGDARDSRQSPTGSGQ